MKKIVVTVVVMALFFCFSGCGKKSGLEGKLVDGNGNPLANVKVVAKQVQPIKGYERFEAVTGADGSFSFNGLYPSSDYSVEPSLPDGTANVNTIAKSRPQGEIGQLPSPLVLRFSLSREGVIADWNTGLEWIVGPDRIMNYYQAMSWVASLGLAGGGWRMPTTNELATLYQRGVSGRNMPPFFQTTGWWVWGEPRDSSSAWAFGFDTGERSWRWLTRRSNDPLRAFGVRARR